MASDLYQYSQINNISFQNVITNLTTQLQDLKTNFSKTHLLKTTIDFVEYARKSITNEKVNFDMISSSTQDSNLLRKLQGFFSYLTEEDIRIGNIGSFMTYIQNMINYHSCPQVRQHLELNIHKIFTLPRIKISLPDIVFLHSLKDHNIIDIMSQEDYNKMLKGSQWSRQMYPVEVMDIPESFKNCFTRNEANDKKSFGSSNIIKSQLSPCLDDDQSEKCSEYCSWHNETIQKWNKSKFLTIMKNFLPRKVMPLSKTTIENDMAKELFPKSKVKDINETYIGPMSPIIYCHDRLNGFQGDDVGMSAKLCNDFFLAPTDQGMCLTKNIDINEVLNSNEDYDLFFETDLQKNEKYFDGETLWTKVRLLIYIDSDEYGIDLRQSFPREPVSNLKEVKFQLHSSKDLAKLLLQDDYNVNLAPITLKAGYEYFIDITPKGTKVSELQSFAT